MKLKDLEKAYEYYKKGSFINNHSKDTSKYINKRYDQLIEMGYTPEQAAHILWLETQAAGAASAVLKQVAEPDCREVGMFIGTEAGAIVGAAMKSTAAVGSLSFTGGFAGAELNNKICGKVIDYATKEGAKKISEHLIKVNKNPSTDEIDMAYVKAVADARNVKKSYHLRLLKVLSIRFRMRDKKNRLKY